MQHNLARYELCQNNFLYIYIYMFTSRVIFARKFATITKKNISFIRGNEDMPKNLLDN